MNKEEQNSQLSDYLEIKRKYFWVLNPLCSIVILG